MLNKRYSLTATQQPYTTALQADDISNLKKGVYTMSRPPIPMELKKKHKREYMRNYRKQKLQQSFGTAFQRTPSPLTAEGMTHKANPQIKLGAMFRF